MPDTAFPPADTTDCHTHVAVSDGRYPMASPRAYTPADATANDMRAMMDRVGIRCIVLVQPSVFAADNACMLDAMAALGPCTRGVVQLADGTPGAVLDDLHRRGVSGIRVNLNSTGLNSPDVARTRLRIAVGLCERNGWHVQLFTPAEVIAGLGAELNALPVPLVLDHFGLLPVVARGGAAERTLRDLLASGRGWVKVSGTYRLDTPTDKAAIAALARDLFADNPQHIVWGSDWPHSPHHDSIAQENPAPKPYRAINPADMLATIAEWFGSDADRRAILAENPARLYGF